MKKLVVLMLSLLLLGCEEIAVQPEDPTMAEALSNFDNALEFETFTTGVISAKDLDSEKPEGLIKLPSNSLPYWARIDPWLPRGIPETKEWGIIYFTVRDVENIPRDFNLLELFDLRAGQGEYALKGYTWFLPDHTVPYVLKVEANPTVVFWIITAEQVGEVFEDGVITMSELESKNPLVGYASKFRKVLKPFEGGAPINTNHTVAQGHLEDGRRFQFEFKARFPGGVDGEFKVKMRIF